jgi:general nucleoside transport system ATP-binding protein
MECRMTEAPPPPRLALHGIGKRFPGVIANRDVSLRIEPGEIHALLGENGAGKSTLVKIIYGILQADAGEIHWNGEPIAIRNPKMARRLGIGMVFQHFSLFEAMSVLENIALGLDDPGDMKTLPARIRATSAEYGLPLDPDRMVHELSIGERQRIEILRCLLQNPKLMILDEPTSVLTPQEADALFQTLRHLAQKGCSLLYISHKLHEIRALCHQATILRAGAVVATCDPRLESTTSMARLMIGADLLQPERQRQAIADATPGATDHEGHHKPRLAVSNLNLPADRPHGVTLKDISFTLKAGDILGIAGVAGNGQNELMAVLNGERLSPDAAAVQIEGQPVGLLDAAARRKLGLACVPEERNGHGAVPEFSLAGNAILSGYDSMGLVRNGFIRGQAATDFAMAVISRFDVRAGHGAESLAGSLSGGNLQKFIVGREIMQEPTILIVSQPTWGVDAGAAATIHRALIGLATQGCAIVLMSQDMDELMALSDRLMVINIGQLSEPIEPSRANLDRIGLLMGGLHGTHSPASAASVADARPAATQPGNQT